MLFLNAHRSLPRLKYDEIKPEAKTHSGARGFRGGSRAGVLRKPRELCVYSNTSLWISSLFQECEFYRY